MEIEEAYNKAISDEKVKNLMRDGFYLSSALLKQAHLDSADSWILIFFNPDSGKVFSATVTASGVEVSTIQDPLVKDDYKQMSLEGKGDISGILKIVSEHFSGQVNQVFISAKPDTWEALVIGTNLNTVFLVIDPKTRKVIKEERGSMLG